MKSVCSIPPHEEVDDGLEGRFRDAWKVAFEAARELKSRFGAEHVYLTGSLLLRDRFHEESDIDLAVDNFDMGQAFDAGGAMNRFWPWSVEIIPLRSVIPEKKTYILQRSVKLET